MEVYSNGKILITGEYAILNGALSLATPTKFGQYLNFKEKSSKFINWKSINYDGNIWFECSIAIENLKIQSTSSKKISDKLIAIINLIRKYNPNFLRTSGSDISTKLTFERNWGLGTSSTLISNLSKLSGVDPYNINNKIFKGSGYDIACSKTNSPILYRLIEDDRNIYKTDFKPSFHNNIYFIFLNKKQNTLSEIEDFKKKKMSSSVINEISNITSNMVECNSIKEFNRLIETHELIISKLISKPTIKETLFNDFKGGVKSLGAWGGDMVMVTSEKDPKKYFKQKGFTTIFKFEELIV